MSKILIAKKILYGKLIVNFLSLNLSRVWQPLLAVKKLQIFFRSGKAFHSSKKLLRHQQAVGWHHSQPSSLLNAKEWVSEPGTDKHSQWSDSGPIKMHLEMWNLVFYFNITRCTTQNSTRMNISLNLGKSYFVGILGQMAHFVWILGQMSHFVWVGQMSHFVKTN